MIMRRTRLWTVAVAASAAVAATALGTAAMGDGRDDSGDKRESHDQRDSRDSWDWSDSRGKEVVRAKLSGYEEDPLTISTPGFGRFVAHIDERNKEIKYQLTYDELNDVQQAHIHFGGRHQSGGIAAFLCSNLKDAKGGAAKHVPDCPKSPAKVEGTIKPEDVVGPAEQGIEPGEFDELVDAIEAGVTYVNVHTKKYPNGEIRGQIKSDEDRKKDDDRKKDHESWGWDASDEGRDRDHKDSDWSRDERDEDRDHGKGDESGRDEDRDHGKGDESGRDEKRDHDKGGDHWDGWMNSEG
ncbi:CHRD domain-containing protein [Micromonospora sp. C28SCA-DRY-2]|uniref:CHRD domain-containing protein n=1 Tax=Micromonospora sp. C28SCA-DRY-2 TaxID=3059522 RepID=UPI002674700B|nr:CHRD domain-containing protein [Micromonospora sp. C28SCA-DRY-2]MDO3700998.1 CHRD domain-containing protein [Micromonospora sp. C28SCA-DRY-2]